MTLLRKKTKKKSVIYFFTFQAKLFSDKRLPHILLQSGQLQLETDIFFVCLGSAS